MAKIGWAAILVLIGLAACQPAPPPNVVQWERDPNTIVFRAEVTGGDQDMAAALNEVPRCTIYGDNLVVWTNEVGAFERQVLMDRVPDAAIARFVEYLAVTERIYTYTQPALTPQPDSQSVIEAITLFVNGLTHRATSFSGWDQNWFQRVVSACTSISQTPVLFAPEGGWLRTIEVSYDINAPSLVWQPSETGVRLADATAEAIWVEGAAVAAAWALLMSAPPNAIVVELDDEAAQTRFFRVVLQVPGITRGAPPAPDA